MSLHCEGCPSSRARFQGTSWQNSLWIWLKARLIEFCYIIKSSNKSAQIPLQLTIQHSWALKANYDEVIISAKGSTLHRSFCIMWNLLFFSAKKCTQPWGKGISHIRDPDENVTYSAPNLPRVETWCNFKAGDYLEQSFCRGTLWLTRTNKPTASQSHKLADVL